MPKRIWMCLNVWLSIMWGKSIMHFYLMILNNHPRLINRYLSEDNFSKWSQPCCSWIKHFTNLRLCSLSFNNCYCTCMTCQSVYAGFGSHVPNLKTIIDVLSQSERLITILYTTFKFLTTEYSLKVLKWY